MSSSGQILLPKDFDVNKINFGSLKTLESGGKTLYINYNKDKFIVQTPEMHIPFGLSNSNDFNRSKNQEIDRPDKWYFDLSFRDMENRPMLQQFFKMMEEMDEKVLDAALQNSQAWFKKKHTNKDVLRELYTPLLKYGKDKDTGDRLPYPPTVKVNLPFANGDFVPDVFDNKKNKIRLADVETKGAKAAVIMQCTGMWIVSGRFGCTWKALQVRISPPSSLKEFAFAPTEEDELNMEESDVDEDAPSNAKPASSSGRGKGGENNAAEPSSNKPPRTIESSDDEDQGAANPGGAGDIENDEDDDIKAQGGGAGAMDEDDEDDLEPPPSKPSAKGGR